MALIDIFRRKSSGNVAKDRLMSVLISDRANCSPETMELIKNDIVEVIRKYMDIDCDNLDIQITQSDDGAGGSHSPTLRANIPIKDFKHAGDRNN